MNSSDSIKYADRKEDGRYILVIDTNTNEVTKSFDYKEIEVKKLEYITTTALKDLKEDGFLHDAMADDLKKYHIAVLTYSKNKLFSVHVMQYKEKMSIIDGCYSGWKYMVTDKKGNLVDFDKNYKKRRAYFFPAVVSLAQVVISIYYLSKGTSSITNGFFTFLMFYIALMYSTFSALAKDLIKRHYLKDNLRRIFTATFVFEIPVLLGAAYTVFKMSQSKGKFDWEVCAWLAAFTLVCIIIKIGATYFLEEEKKYK